MKEWRRKRLTTRNCAHDCWPISRFWNGNDRCVTLAAPMVLFGATLLRNGRAVQTTPVLGSFGIRPSVRITHECEVREGDPVIARHQGVPGLYDAPRSARTGNVQTPRFGSLQMNDRIGLLDHPARSDRDEGAIAEGHIPGDVEITSGADGPVHPA